MFAANPSRRAKGVATTLVCALALVGLAAGYATLSVTLTSAAHACCQKQNVDLPCLTLCAASQTVVVLAAEVDTTPDSIAVVLPSGRHAIPPARPVFAPSAHLKPDSSPPLYLRHAALLI